MGSVELFITSVSRGSSLLWEMDSPSGDIRIPILGGSYYGTLTPATVFALDSAPLLTIGLKAKRTILHLCVRSFEIRTWVKFGKPTQRT